MSAGGRRPMSARMQLTVSYAGFLLVAGAVLMSVVWLFLLRYVPDSGALPSSGVFVPGQRDLIRAFVPPASGALVFLIVFGLIGGWFLAGRMLAPLAQITAAARRAGEGSLTHRVGLVDRRDEFGVLADSFDAMLARLETHVAEQQRFAAGASHELRTPLATMQAMLEVAGAEPHRDVDELVRRLRSVNTRAIELTEALLLLGRADRGGFAREPVDVSLLVEEAVETLLPLSEKHAVTIDVTSEIAVVTGSSTLLLQLVTNLLHNAIVHNDPRGGLVSVQVTATIDGAAVLVQNTGEQVDPAILPILLEPFQRATGRVRAEREGVGLGLAIAQRIVVAHGGVLTLGARPEGGLNVTVRLPASR